MVKKDFLGAENAWIVLAGGLNADGTLPHFVIERVKRVRGLASPFEPVIFSSVFTLNVPQKLNSIGYVLSESNQMLNYFIATGGDPDQCFVENSSFDTVGSAFFLRNNFDFLLQNRNVNVVTSEFHINRVKSIFHFIFKLEPKFKGMHELRFHSTKNPPHVASRLAKEKVAEQLFLEEVRDISDIEGFKWWLFSQHTNYNRTFSSTRFQNDPDALY